jgi:hypothetical protein
MYKNNLIFNDNFRYSINLNMDLHRLDKVNGFVVTKTATDLLTELVDSLNSENPKPQLFIGPYGKGKSHLLLVLSELIYSKNYEGCEQLVRNLINTDQSFGNKLEEMKSKRYLPIVINGAFDSFKSEIILEIKRRFQEEDIDKFDYQTAYGLANELIVTWENDDYAKARLTSYLSDRNIGIDSLKNGLSILSVDKLNIFKRLYRYMMYNQEFEPLVNQNITQILIETSTYLKENTEFEGLLLVIDEFSKLLEGNAAIELYSDIQNIAEATATNPIRLICVAHKRISAYTEHLTNDKRNEWKKIEGRFDSLYFGLFEDQSYYYKLIEKAVEKKKITDSKLLEISKEIYHSFVFSYTSNDIDEDLIVNGGFPLNPYTTHCLIRLSEKIGQNERSLFTFLCSDQNNGLRKIIERNDDDLVSVDLLYDYFKNSFKDNKNSNTYKAYIKAETIIDQLEDEIQKKIVKTIAIFYVVNEMKVLVPRAEYISRALNGLNIEKQLNDLVEAGLLIKKANTGNYGFLLGEGNNLQLDINKAIELNYKNIRFLDAFDELFNNKFITPNRYNYDNSITRFFRLKFVDSSLLLDDKFDLIRYLENDFADGYIVYAVSINEIEHTKMIEKASEIAIDRVVIIPIQITISDKTNIYDLMKNQLAVVNLMDDKKFKYDEFIKTELKLLYTEYEYSLNTRIDEIIKSTVENHIFYDGVEIEQPKNMIKFNAFLSDIMTYSYNCMPVVNYELVNKNNISSPAKKARRYSLEKIFDEEYEINNLRETSAEKTMYRSLIENTGIRKIDAKDIVADKSTENKHVLVIRKIHEYFINADENSSMIELYKVLQEKPYGLRKGIIIIYIAKYLSQHRKSTVVIMNGKELSLTLNYLELIDEQPENFVVHISKENEESLNYLKRINKLYSNRKSYNNLNIYEETYRKIEEYFRQLPACSKNMTYIFNNSNREAMSKQFVQIKREVLKYDVNSKFLLTETIPNKIFKDKSYDEQLKDFELIKSTFDNYLTMLKKYLINKTIKELGFESTDNLKSCLMTWVGDFNNENLIYIDEVKFLRIHKYILEELKDTEFSIIEDIAHMLSGVAIEDWNDKSLEIFEDTLGEIVDVYSSIDSIDNRIDNKDFLELNIKDQSLKKYIQRREITDEIKQVMDDIEYSIEEYMLDDKDKQTLFVNLIEKFFNGEL